MRVCHLGKFYSPASGGIETHLQTLCAQAKLGAQVQVVCVNHQDRARRDVTWENFTPTRRLEQWDGPVRLTRLGRLASLARFDFCPGLPGLFSQLSRLHFDLLHLHVPNPTMVVALALMRPRTPWVITYHSDVVRQKFLAKLVRPFADAVFHRARAILASSPTYPLGSEYLQKLKAKVKVVPFGIELGPLLNPDVAAREAAARFRADYGQPLWLSVGRLVYYKGLENALRALPHVPGRLLVVGEGPLRRELGELAARLGVADRVIWRGRLSDTELVGAYHAATALWFPSNARSEAFGFVQIEAMACGCPVINADIPGSGVPWVSKHEETGLTVRVNDAEGLAQAARRLLEEPGLRDRLSERARTRAELEFGAELMAQRTLAIYSQVLGGSAF